MSEEFDTEKFHEREDFTLELPSATDRLRLSEHLATLGCVVERESDFAYLPRDNESCPWQASDVTQIDFFLHREPSVFPNAADRMNFIYLLATLPETAIAPFVSLIQSCIAQFGGELLHRGAKILPPALPDILRAYVAELRGELSDETGTEFVARMLYEFKPRA